MSDQEIHWTDDESLLERFVLENLSRPEREVLARHLRTCEICQRAVREEQRLVTGVRSAGREELKERLRTRVATPGRRDIPWPRVLSLAATIVVLIGVGIYNGWFGPRHEEPLSDVAPLSHPPATDRQSATATEEKKTAQEKGILQHENVSGAPAAERGKAVSAEPRVDPRETESAAQRLNEGYAGRSEEDLAPAEAEKAKDEFAASVGESRDAVAQTAWVVGNILPSAPQPSLEEGKRDAAVSQYKTRAKEGAARPAARPVQVSQAFNGQAIVLNQNPSQELPPAQLARQRLSGGQNALRQRTIETRVQFLNQTLNLTLYLDSLVDESDLANAIVEQVNQDSLIVHIAQQRIGFRIPASLATQTRAR